jgi:DNA-binding transcriptional regulator LsrR (DeoR family)
MKKTKYNQNLHDWDDCTMLEFDKSFLLKVSRLYYLHDFTHEELAAKFGVSRFMILKALQQSRIEGLIDIKIYEDSFHTIKLEHIIESAFPLQDIIVVPSLNRSPSLLNCALSKAASRYVSNQLDDVSKIGISWGTTLHSFMREFPDCLHDNLKVLPLIGNMGNRRMEIHSNQIASELSKKLRCRFASLFAPAVVKNKTSKEKLLQIPEISEVLEEAKQVDMAIVGVANPLSHSTMQQIGCLGPLEINELIRSNAVSDINSCFIHADGTMNDIPMNDQIIGVNIEDLRKVKKVVAISRGLHKVDSILAALKSGFITSLITDEMTALSLVGKINGKSA